MKDPKIYLTTLSTLHHTIPPRILSTKATFLNNFLPCIFQIIMPTHDCTICLSTMVTAAFHCPNNCIFHQSCIHKWVEASYKTKGKPTCPNCNQDAHSRYAPDSKIKQQNEKVKSLNDTIRLLQMENFGLRQQIHMLHFQYPATQSALNKLPPRPGTPNPTQTVHNQVTWI